MVNDSKLETISGNMVQKRKSFDGLPFWTVSIAGGLLLCWSLWRICFSGIDYRALAIEVRGFSSQWNSKIHRYDPNVTSVIQQNQNVSSAIQQNQTKENEMDGKEEEPLYRSMDEWEESSDNFYADSDFSYTVGNTVKNWDAKRQQWLRAHPHIKNYTEGGRPRILVLTGSQPYPCKNPIGDHLILRTFKNKQDYCRIHGLDMFYNTILLNQKMASYWAKIPLIRTAMVAHPEAEWIWWLDSDAVITDMEFEHPLEKYKDFNFVLHGWEKNVYEKRSWLGINAGVFLIRNCEWSMDFMERWSVMGPESPLYESFAKILSDVLPDRPVTESDDQSALVYLMIKEKKKWGGKIYIENEYYFQGFWLDIVGTFENISKRYEAMEAEHTELSRRYAEKSARLYAVKRERYLKEIWAGLFERRPFVTHFAGCQPCSGNHNPIYKAEDCQNGLQRSLDFADDQVLRIYGFRRQQLQSVLVNPIHFHP